MATIVINGGGLCGAFVAAVLAKRKDVSEVVVYEKRPDIRDPSCHESGRSINLIITSRGLYALRQAGLEEASLKLCVPVRGRMIHSLDGSTKFQPYGIAPNEVNYSVSRTALNALLIDEAERRGAKFRFCHSITSLDLDTRTAEYEIRDSKEKVKQTATAFIGTDGVASVTRQTIVDRLRSEGVKVFDTPSPLGISYKEISFPPKDGKYCMAGDGLHIWPRGAHFLMGLADLENSFTGTMYLPDGAAELKVPAVEQLPPRFEELEKDPKKFEEYVAKFYPDLPSLVPNYKEQFASHPVGFLATIHCSHWNYKGVATIFGDSSHGVVPFLGQGMNCGFESWVVLEKCLDKHGMTKEGLEAAFNEFTAVRPVDSEAIAAMAEENFVEMSYKVGQEEFLRRKAIENAVEQQFPHLLRSRYYMVVATLIPYSVVKAGGHPVDACIDSIIAKLDALSGAPPAQGDKVFGDGVLKGLTHDAVMDSIEAHVTPFVKKHNIDFTQPLKTFY